MEAPAQSRAALTLAALGVVYGDIGTSPLYALKETLSPAHGIPAGPETVLGAASAIFWALMLVVSLKYVLLVLRADNHGEGGIMALLALARQAVAERPRALRIVTLAGMAGTALFYGDAVLTPAISVLSAVEGLSVSTHVFEPYVVPLAIAVLTGLFLMQQNGTASVGAWFGPIALLWFVALAIGGVYQIAQYPQVLHALYPEHAWWFLTQHGFASFVVLGAVALCRHGAFRSLADPAGMVWLGVPRIGAELSGPGRTVVAGTRRRTQSLLSALSGLGALSHGAAGDRSDGDRRAGHAHRRILAHATGYYRPRPKYSGRYTFPSSTGCCSYSSWQ